jgi:threonine dehydratase
MNEMKELPEYSDICDAHKRIKDLINRTPVLTSSMLDSLSGASLFFKCENFQKSGAFKYRGATNAILQLDKAGRSASVVTHSSGNHAGALAKAALVNGIKAYIVMPENAPEVKKRAVLGYGAEITFCKPTLQAREEAAASIIYDKGAVLIHPYDNFNVIAGQGTAAKELLEDFPDLDAVITPVGGGGLFSGTLISAKSINPGIKVWGAEPEGADDAYRSLKTGKLVPSVNPVTIADGLLTSLSPRTFSAIQSMADGILTVSDIEISEAMRYLWERMKVVTEPSAAVTLAAVLKNRVLFSGKKIGLILSGGNADLLNLPFRGYS